MGGVVAHFVNREEDEMMEVFVQVNLLDRIGTYPSSTPQKSRPSWRNLIMMGGFFF